MKKIFLILSMTAAFSSFGFGQSNPPLKVREVDGAPTKSGINTLVVSNGSLSVSGTTATVTTGVSGLSDVSGTLVSSSNFRVPSGGSPSATTLQLGVANTGFYLTSGLVAVSSAGAAMMLWNGSNGHVTIPAGYQHSFGSLGLSSPDVGLIRHAAGVLRITNANGSSGQLLIGASGATAGGQAHVISSAAGTTGLRVDSAASPTSPIFDVRVDGTADSGIKVDGSTTTGDTRFFLYDATAGTIKRVLVGASDSGGTGFKMLRVAN